MIADQESILMTVPGGGTIVESIELSEEFYTFVNKGLYLGSMVENYHYQCSVALTLDSS